MSLNDDLDLYLTQRRALGYQLTSVEYLLRQFCGWLETRDKTDTFTIDDTVEWARDRPNAAAVWWSQRLTAERLFAGWLNTRGVDVPVIPAALLLAHAMPNQLDHAATISRVLAIPPKRHPKPMLEFLTAPEANALIAAPDRTRWTGRRDRALIVLAIQTGLRISELRSLTYADVHLGTGANVTCTGKTAASAPHR